MVSIKLKNREKMNINNIVKYIQENTPKKIKNEKVDSIIDEGKSVKREYSYENDKGELNKFIMEISLENDDTYITHEIFYNAKENNVLDLNSLLD